MARQRVDFITAQNQMSKFLLDDGTEIRIQIVLTNVTRTDEKLPDGQYKHEFQLQPVIEQLAPEGEVDVRKLAGGAKHD